ncbi:hypothetical protein ACS0TY_006094 [Phlomoides rotata]
MLKIETTDDGGRTTWARACHTCCSAPSAVYCRTDLAFLCTTCDARVWVCDSCERAPAGFLCKADSASLCAACDADIHSANPLARRHHRVPIQPALYGHNSGGFVIRPSEDEDEDEAASWLLMNPMKIDEEEQSIGGPALFGGEVDEYLDLDEYNSCQNNQFNEGSQHYGVRHGGDSVVPIQGQNEHHCFQLGLEGGYGYSASISQSVSISSMEVGVVPESTSEVSMAYTRPPKGTIDLFSSPPIQVMPTQLSPMDREARVLRYKEKKKNRRFEKTIRYASRKAYAETRPRIKGRFAKRRDAKVEVDQMFSSASLMTDAVYGVVPSF